jgi:hypothetical protein
MLDRPKLTKTRGIKGSDTKESAPDIVTGQGKPSFQQFRLKVDGQTKDSFATMKQPKKPG